MTDFIFQNVVYKYPGTERNALDALTLRLGSGKRAALIGRNGSGKSTLMKIANGILFPAEGRIIFDGRVVGKGKRESRFLRERVGIVLQNPEDQLFSASVFQDISAGPLNIGLTSEEACRRVAEVAALVRARLFPQLNWAELLRRFIELSASNDYSWSPPNKRYIHAGLYLPSTRAQDLPHTIVAVDTSGSISPAELDQFAAELSSILYDFDTIVSVVYCDSAVSGVQEFARMDLPLKLSPKGGGGTDYCPVFSWVEENGIQPACLVYLTDLECNRYPAEPYYPVLWVTTSPNRLPPFGERIQLAL